MDTEDLRVAVYDRFRRGEIPRVAALAHGLSVTVEEVSAGLTDLAAQQHVALGADGDITMAHPFTAVPLWFSDGPRHPVVPASHMWTTSCTPAATSESSAPRNA